MKIFLDESGNTGIDYLNVEQPYFVLAANWMDYNDCEGIRNKVFSEFQGNEYKFSKLLRGNEKRIVDFIKTLKTKDHLYCSYIIDKKSVLLERFVHDCIEPSFFKVGFDIMEKGGALEYTNILNLILKSEMGMPWFNRFLELFNNLIRFKNENALEIFHNHCLQGKEKSYYLLLPFINFPELSLNEVLGSHNNKYIYEAFVFGLIVHLRDNFQIKDFEIIYDPIKATTDESLCHFTSVLNFVDESFIQGIFEVHNDIKIKLVKSEDSKNVNQIQISDLIAGLTNYSLKVENLDKKISKLFQESMSDRNLIHKICLNEFNPSKFNNNNANNSMKLIEKAFRKKNSLK